MAISFDDFLKKAGGTVQDVKPAGGDSAYVAQQRSEMTAHQKAADDATAPLSIAKETAKGVINQVISGVKGTGESLGESAAAGDVAKNVTEGDLGLKDTALRVLKQIKADRAAGKDTSRLEEAYNHLAGHSQENDLKNLLPTLNKTNLDAVLEAIDVGALALTGGSLEVGAAGAKAAAVAARAGASKVADEALQAASDLRKQVQVYSAKHTTVGPQFEESAKRLFLDGTKALKDPVGTYDKYVGTAKKALTDIKADPPLAQVGESIGSAFKNVVAQRRAVGKAMGDELKKVGSITTNVLPTADKFVSTLGDEGLVYDRVKKEVLATAKQTKMTDADTSLLTQYAQSLQKLGSKPTVKDLDAFMSRVSGDLDLYKSKNNITGSTNAERIIKGSLTDLRGLLDPAKGGDKALTKYAEARNAYHKLSDFMDEGASYLGKITQSGDFAKDASLAKSAVQSILNNGKKDWLIKLEGLTGYPAIDDAVLALQAMKDAGDFRGLSLLQTLADGAIPTSKAGLTQRVIDFALQHASKAVAGSPEEQTRAFLKTLGEKIPK